jgi:hypothetical protein
MSESSALQAEDSSLMMGLSAKTPVAFYVAFFRNLILISWNFQWLAYFCGE